MPLAQRSPQADYILGARLLRLQCVKSSPPHAPSTPNSAVQHKRSFLDASSATASSPTPIAAATTTAPAFPSSRCATMRPAPPPPTPPCRARRGLARRHHRRRRSARSGKAGRASCGSSSPTSGPSRALIQRSTRCGVSRLLMREPSRLARCCWAASQRRGRPRGATPSAATTPRADQRWRDIRHPQGATRASTPPSTSSAALTSTSATRPTRRSTTHRRSRGPGQPDVPNGSATVKGGLITMLPSPAKTVIGRVGNGQQH